MTRVHRYADIVVLSVLALLLLIVFFSLFDVFANRSDYVFGTEVAGWRYRSEATFIGLSLIEVCIIFAGLIGPKFIPGRMQKVVARIIVLVVLLAVMLSL